MMVLIAYVRGGLRQRAESTAVPPLTIGTCWVMPA